MSRTHWKKLNNPDFLGAYAIEPGTDLIATIDYAQEETFTGNGGKKDAGLVVHFMESDIKPLICNATNAKTITKVCGSPYIEDWHGSKIAFYVAEVSAFGETVDALRVRPYVPKVEGYFCKSCGTQIQPYKNFTARQMAERSKSKFGKVLCVDCAKEESEKETTEDILDAE